jgi:hypothetical protein
VETVELGNGREGGEGDKNEYNDSRKWNEGPCARDRSRGIEQDPHCGNFHGDFRTDV